MMLFASLSAAAKQPAAADAADAVTGAEMLRDGSRVAVTMNILKDRLGVKSNRAVVLTPSIVNGSRRLTLPAVGVYGSRRWWHYLRENKGMISGPDERSYRVSAAPDTIGYLAEVPVEDWMNGGRLEIDCQEYGCRNCKTQEQSDFIAFSGFDAKDEKMIEYVPVERLIVQSDTILEINGSAYVIFPVNSTDLLPTLHNNAAELAKITLAIDSLRADPQFVIKSISMKGYASPEGNLENNERLAKGRTEALAEYISQKYDLQGVDVSTAFEAEDWQGLRRYVAAANLPNGREIISIIDSQQNPDDKESNIRTAFPKDYAILLKQYYPALRHTDYTIRYMKSKNTH